MYGKSRIRCMKRFVRKWPSISPLARRCGGPHIHEYRFGPPTRCFAPSRELGPPGASRFAQSLPSVLPSTSWCASSNLTSHFRSPAGKRSASCVCFTPSREFGPSGALREAQGLPSALPSRLLGPLLLFGMGGVFALTTQRKDISSSIG